MFVYLITNILSGKQYVGQTSRTVATRFNRHCSGKDKTAISKAIAKYGKENFTIIVVSECGTQEQLNDAEMYFIDHYQTRAPNGYNVHEGGRIHTWTDELKARFSNSRKGAGNPMYGAKLNEKQKEALSVANRKPKSEAHKRNMSLSRLGKRHSAESKAKMSSMRKGIINSGQFKKGRVATNKQKVLCSNGIVYNSIAEAAILLNVDRSCVYDVLAGRSKSVKGLAFKKVVSCQR